MIITVKTLMDKSRYTGLRQKTATARLDRRCRYAVDVLWPGGAMVMTFHGLETQTVTVQLPPVLLSGKNLRQVVHTHVPLSPNSINWYRSNGGDALRLGR